MNPYVSNPDNAGRLHVDLQHVNSQSANFLQYWASVVDLCNESVRIYPADEGGRDVFALGSVIIKSSQLHKTRDGRHTEIDYLYADANEVQAVAIAKNVLRDVRVPEIYFAGKVLALSDSSAMSLSLTPLQINDRQVLVQERIPGVGLNVEWPYLSQGQKESFKQQAREILRQLHTIKPTDGRRARCHVVQDPNVLTNGRIRPLEGDILFSDTNIDPDMSFTHNQVQLHSRQ
ncbi:MAG: hypothetical protein M1839_004672 [Geoglossum umbratile]|nr:MAG: hypothetical protein M1839_004672 [Geoglossum umbratile]